MADNIVLPGVGESIATDEIAGIDYQKMKLFDGTADSTTPIAGDTTNGLDVDVTRIRNIQTPAGDSMTDDVNDALRVNVVTGSTAGTEYTEAAVDTTITGTAVMWEDASDTLRAVSTAKPLPVNLVTGGGSGGTAVADDADFTPFTTLATPVMGTYESAPTAVTDGDLGVIGITPSRQVKVSVEASSLDVAHGSADAGQPVKVGGKAVSTLPTRVDTDDRANMLADLFGRVLVSHIDPVMQVAKSFNATTAQTGALIWDPTSGKKIAITSIVIGSYGVTSGRLILWFGDTADTAYTAGTDQLVLAASFAPATTAKPGLTISYPTPIFCTTADRELHITTDAALSVDVSVYGYEWV